MRINLTLIAAAEGLPIAPLPNKPTTQVSKLMRRQSRDMEYITSELCGVQIGKYIQISEEKSTNLIGF